MMPSQAQKLVSAKLKLNNRCREISQEVYTLTGNDLQDVDPDAFLDKTNNFILKRDQETHFNGFAKSGDSFEGNNVVDPRISSADKAIGSETSKSSERQQSLNFNPVTEMSGSSQGSYSSQSTSLNSSIQGNNAPVASMIDTSGFLGAASTESNNAGLTAHLPIPLTAPQLKRSYSTAIGKMCKGRRLNGKYDPENHEIMRLRQEENLDFQEIANKLNEARYKTGGKDELTDNAVYSRYTRNAPLIAQMRNEKFVPTAKDNQYTKMKFSKVVPISGFNPHEDMLLEMATQHVQEQFWAIVSKRIEELGGGYHDPETCERRFDCL